MVITQRNIKNMASKLGTSFYRVEDALEEMSYEDEDFPSSHENLKSVFEAVKQVL